MSDTLILTASPGLTAANFAFGLYKDGVAQSAAGLSVVELTIDAFASNYVVQGRPAQAFGEHWTLTWDDGTQRGSRRYPINSSQPPNLILPIRDTGVVLADLNSKLYLDGTQVALGGLTLANLGAPLNDYKLSNLPVPVPGSYYTWSYSYGAFYQVEIWPLAIGGVNVALPAVTDTAIVDDLEDCFPDTVTAQFGTLDGTGLFTPSGAGLDLPAYISGKARLVRNRTGEEVVSSLKITVGGVFGIDADSYRFTVPTRYTQRSNIQAIAVSTKSDENGPHHEVIFLP